MQMKGRPLLHAHFLEDLEERYAQSVYRYQEAVAARSSGIGSARAYMNRLEAEVRRMKYGY